MRGKGLVPSRVRYATICTILQTQSFRHKRDWTITCETVTQRKLDLTWFSLIAASTFQDGPNSTRKALVNLNVTAFEGKVRQKATVNRWTAEISRPP